MKIGHSLAVATIGVATLFGPQTIAEEAKDPLRAEAVQPLLRAARIEQLMQVVATEGTRHGVGLEKSLFPGRGGSSWATLVAAIQSPDRLARRLAEVLDAELSDEDAALAATYLSDGAGARIVAREVETRLEMLDGAVEAEAKRVSTEVRDADPGRAALVDELLDALDLLPANVSGGLNANFAFYRGLGDGGALKKRLTESEMLAMVWAQEDSVRAATRDWLQGYLTRAYAPLAEDDLRDYLAFATTPVGQRYFAAMFAGFGTVFEETSYEMGLAAARFMAQDDA
ncbi:MAG: hypothetical protein AAF390_17515 [Pseudomonadota bacterium]